MVKNKWVQKSGYAKRIAVDGSGIPYVVNRSNMIYKWDERRNTWTSIPGKATDIGVSSKGDLWIISTDRESGGYGIYNRTKNTWIKISGSA